MVLTLAGKELKTLFTSPLAWVVLTAVQAIVGYAFLRRLDDFLQLQPQLAHRASPPGATELIAAPTFGTAAAVLLFAVPILAMRLVAEERRNQTMALLMSAPVSMTEIVFGKFFGLLAFLALIVATIALMPLSLAAATRLDYGLLAGLAAGLLLAAASFAAVCLFISCLTTHPVAAAIAGFATLLGMMLVSEAAGEGLRARGWPVAAALVQVLSPVKNFEPFTQGLFDSYAVACSVLLIAVALALAIRQLDAQRLRG
jgi:ABC-2 type transport system permease protein